MAHFFSHCTVNITMAQRGKELNSSFLWERNLAFLLDKMLFLLCERLECGYWQLSVVIKDFTWNEFEMTQVVAGGIKSMFLTYQRHNRVGHWANCLCVKEPISVWMYMNVGVAGIVMIIIIFQSMNYYKTWKIISTPCYRYVPLSRYYGSC